MLLSKLTFSLTAVCSIYTTKLKIFMASNWVLDLGYQCGRESVVDAAKGSAEGSAKGSVVGSAEASAEGSAEGRKLKALLTICSKSDLRLLFLLPAQAGCSSLTTIERQKVAKGMPQ